MPQHAHQLHRMLNPVSGEIKLVPTKEARHLRTYGWRSASLAEYLAYQSAVANYTALKHTTKLIRH